MFLSVFLLHTKLVFTPVIYFEIIDLKHFYGFVVF